MILVYLGGNGYTYQLVKGFLHFLVMYDIVDSYIYVPLMENQYEDLSYDILHPNNYSNYIYSKLPDKSEKYIFFGTSMGCYHLQNYAARFPDTIEAMVWLEPTMCGGNYKLLKAYETGRGNKDWITELYDEKIDHPEWDSNTKVIDIAVSNDLDNDFSRDIKLGIIYTTLNNMGKKYTPIQLKAKDEFLKELKDKGYHFEFELVKGPHTLDVYPKYYQVLSEFILKVI